MIKKLVISAVVLTALISSKDANAFGIGGFARGLATSGAFQIHTAEIPTADVEKGSDGAVVPLTFAKQRELLRVSAAVDGAIAETDNYLDTLAGDFALPRQNCTDCADLKRDQLTELGWSEDAMRIGYSLGADGRLERVLIVATDRGDIVLGNDGTLAAPAAKRVPAAVEMKATVAVPAFLDL